MNHAKIFANKRDCKMEKLDNVSGLSLGLNESEVITVGNVTLIYYVTDRGQKRLKIIAPREVNIGRIDREEYLKYKTKV
jgi:hypothetical protein